MLILLVVALLALGAMVGGIVVSSVTGDWHYTIAWTIAMGVLILCLIVLITSRVRRATNSIDRPISRLPRAVQTTLAVVLVVAGATVIVVPAGSELGDNTNYLTGSRQQQAVNAIARVVGNHELVDIDFYDGYVDAQAPTGPGADTEDNYEYRYGQATRQSPEQGPNDTKTAEYDGRQVDFALIPKLIEDAEHRTKTASPTSLHVSVMQPLDVKIGQAPTINVEVDSAYHSNQVHYSPQGKFLDGVGDAFPDN